MSGSSLPYRLRPHKAVDRRLFLELLQRCERWRSLDDHAYVSMASYTMEDHKLVHRLIGIDRLLAFDLNPEIVKRQLFNRPIEGAKCVELTAATLSNDIQSEVEKAGIEGQSGYIIWLDYTDPKFIAEQIKEFEQICNQLDVGDIIRITVNAEFDWWGGKSHPSDPTPLDKRQIKAHEKLKNKLGDNLPNDVVREELDEAGIATVLSRCFGAAAGRAVKASSGKRLAPLSMVRYADGAQMLSMTAILIERSDEEEMRNKLGLPSWPFASHSWSNVHYLAVPDLTIRERLMLERCVEKSDQELIGVFGFNFDEVTEREGFVQNFKNYYRHYPALTPVEV